MSFDCPKGHVSNDADYCSTCGSRISPASGPDIKSKDDACPECSTPRVPDMRFCEVCRHDFEMADQPGLPVQNTVVAKPVPPTPVPAVKPSTPVNAKARLMAVIKADISVYNEDPCDDTPFPVNHADRIFHLDLPENLVGRTHKGKDIFPEIPLSDPGASSRHLKLIQAADGTWQALELGSANGTRLNDKPMEPGVPENVQSGDAFKLGMWTKIVLASR